MYPDHVLNGLRHDESRRETDFKQQFVEQLVQENFMRAPPRRARIDNYASTKQGEQRGSQRKRPALNGKNAVGGNENGAVAAAAAATTATGGWTVLAASDHSMNTVNPIRRIVDVMAVEPNPTKSLIKLHLGDPTLTGALPPCDTVVQAMQKAVTSHKFDGYGPAVGIQSVREVLARFVTTPEAPVTAEDLILTSGCSHSLQMVIEAIANPGDNILVPKPGFPLYATLMRPHGIEDRSYNLQMEKGASVDLAHLESQIDEKTRAIIVNNPSNPTGAVYSKCHLEAILRIAERRRVPIIADEIYGDMTYDGAVFYPMATLEPKVPLISCDGIAKRYLVPGWRLGWITLHDRHGALVNIRHGLRNLAQKIVGPCALVQGALPEILTCTTSAFFEHTKEILSANAAIVYETLSAVPGLKPVRPYGAMYCMVGFDGDCFPMFKDDEMAFVRALIAEESVYCLPGTAFNIPGWFRLVLTYPPAVTQEACNRLRHFCHRHYSLRRPLQTMKPRCELSSVGLGEYDK
jgi:tyrosine aminotransferase